MTINGNILQTGHNIMERILLFVCGLVMLPITISIAIVETIVWLLIKLIGYNYPYWFTQIFGAITIVAICLAFDR